MPGDLPIYKTTIEIPHIGISQTYQSLCSLNTHAVAAAVQHNLGSLVLRKLIELLVNRVVRDGKIGPGIYLKDGRKYQVYYPTIYACSPANKGRHQVIQIPPKVKVHPDIPKKDLESIRCIDDIIVGKLIPAKNWDDYWQAYSDIMDRAIEQIAPGSGFLFTPRIFAARPGVLPKWEVKLGYNVPIGLGELAIYPPEYEDAP